MSTAVRDRPTRRRNAADAAVATLGVAALAIVCCAALLLGGGLAGSAAIGTLLGGAAWIVAAGLILRAVAITLRSRRASCPIDGQTEVL